MAGNKNLTITLTNDEHKKVDKLIAFFQEKHITTVTKTDVIKFLINSAYTGIIENGKNVEEILQFRNENSRGGNK